MSATFWPISACTSPAATLRFAPRNAGTPPKLAKVATAALPAGPWVPVAPEAAEGREHTPDQMFGTWNFVRANKAICQIALMDTAADTDSFALETKPGCDQLVTRFAPRAWQPHVALDSTGLLP